MKLSIVTSVYYSASYLRQFYLRMTSSVRKITPDYEIIFVNDGSPDTSREIILAIAQKDKKIKLIELSRNFGHHKALMTGLSTARGDYVYLADCDLEEIPELINIFWKQMQLKKADVVYGIQKKREGGYLRKFIERFFYQIFNFFSDYKIPENLSMTRLMTHEYVKSLVSHRETNVVLAGLWTLTGFNQQPILIDKSYKGKSAYTFRKKISIMFDSITSFSAKPLIYIFVLGIIIMLLSLLMMAEVLYQRIIHGKLLEGWTSIIVSIWFLGGLIVFGLGIIGIYISKIFIETKNRPYTIIKKSINNL